MCCLFDYSFIFCYFAIEYPFLEFSRILCLPEYTFLNFNLLVMLQTDCKNTKSSEKFEVNQAFLQISEQIKSDLRKKTIEEAINYLVGKFCLNDLCSKRLKTVNISSDYINGVVDFGMAPVLVSICERLKEAAISSIAEEIASRSDVRIILIAGPSSSGKTTFCKKLTYAIEQQGLHAHGISLDDYYLDRELTPKDENGELDFETLYSLNLELIQSHLTKLLNGEEVELPRYDFAAGKSFNSGNTMKLDNRSVLIVEGIHGLNPLLTGSIPDKNIFRIYISGLTTYLLPDGSVFPTTDNRLLRRMVRDSQFRNTNARQTIARWPSVRRGEEKWIVPFQSNADVNLCTAYQYEICLLKQNAIPLLREVPADSPEYSEAQRLLKVCSMYNAIPVEVLPPYSLLREFLGGSAYEY